MAITFPSQTAVVSGQTGDLTAWSVDIPSDVSGGIQAGDLIIVCAIHMESEDNDWSPDPPTNMDGRWVNEHQVGQTPASIPGISVYYKIAEGDEDGETVSMTADFAGDLGWMAFVIRGVDITTPLDVSIQTAQSTATGDPDPPAITPANDDCMILVLGIQDALDTTTTLTNHPTNYTGIGFASIINSSSYTSGNICAAYRILSGGGSSSENPGAWNLSIDDEWGAITIALRPAAAGGISSIDSDYGAASDEFDVDENSLDINGSNFEAAQGSGAVYLADESTLAASDAEVDLEDAINTWSDTEINLDLTDLGSTALANIESLISSDGHSLYVIVENDSSDEYSLAVTVHRAKAFGLAASSYIAASGENTTARLAAPSVKTTGDFDAGRIQDDENPCDAINITEDDYTEIEWCIEALAGSVEGETYQFRLLFDGEVIDTYTVTPEVTIASGVTVGMNAITLASSAQSANVQPGTVNPTMEEITAAGSAQAATIQPGGVAPDMSEITLVGSPQSATVLPGETTVPMSETTLAGSAQAASVLPGEIVVPVSEVTVAGAAQAASIATSTTIGITAITATGAPQAAAIIPGDITASMSAAILTGSAETASILPGEATIPAGYITLAGAAQGATAFASIAVGMSEITGTFSAQGATVQPGAISTDMQAITLVGSLPSASITGETIIDASAITLAGTTQTGTVFVSTGVGMSAITGTFLAQGADVQPGEATISMNEITLMGTGVTATILPGAIVVSTSSATLAGSVPTGSIIVSLGVQMSAITGTTTAQSFTVIPGATSVGMGVATLVSTTLGAAIIVASTIPAGAITLTSSAEGATIFVSQGISMSAITLAGASQGATVIPGATTVDAGAIIGTFIAQTANIAADQLILFGAITVAGSLPQASVFPGEVTPQASAITLASGVQQSAVIPGTAIVPMSGITGTFSGQAATIVPGAIMVTVSAITGTFAPQTFTIAFPGLITDEVMLEGDFDVTALLLGDFDTTTSLDGDFDVTVTLKGSTP